MSFVDRYYAESEPSAGQRIYARAEERLKNLTTVRASAGVPKKTPNALPFSCCPDVAFPGSLAPLGIPNEVRITGGPEPGDTTSEGTEGELASVYLEITGASLVRVVVAVRDFAGLGLSEAKSLVESAPVIVLSNVPRGEAERLKRELERVGATASLK